MTARLALLVISFGVGMLGVFVANTAMGRMIEALNQGPRRAAPILPFSNPLTIVSGFQRYKPGDALIVRWRAGVAIVFVGWLGCAFALFVWA